MQIFLIVFFLSFGLNSHNIRAQSPDAIEKYTQNREARMAWWKDARYGMFIHWGAYAQLAGEWQGKPVDGIGEWIMYNAQIPVKEYEAMAKNFNPQKFDADEWVSIVREAGMKYIVITAKHCDGFAMYNSDVTNYNILDHTPFQRDPIMELKQACQKQGIKLGFYYSHNWDWHEPDALGLYNTWDFPDKESKNPEKYYQQKSLPQIKELVTKYQPDIMWFDVPTDIPQEVSFEILKMIREIHPDCIINDRISHEHQQQKIVMGDFYTPEQYIPANLNLDFETCMTLNDTWGYKYNDTNWKDPKTIVQNLVKNASMGGNYLLNVGPDKHGKIPFQSVMILKTVGDWLHENGESIYGSTANPLQHLFYENAVCTTKEGKLFIHLFQWPEKEELLLGEINAAVEKIYLLADKKQQNLSFQQLGNNDIIIDLTQEKIAAQSLNNLVNTLVIEYAGQLQLQKLPVLVDPFNTATFTPASATFTGNASYAFNNRWGEHRGYEMKEWNDGGTIQWDFRSIREGTYQVQLVYGANELSVDSDIHVEVNREKFKHKISEAGKWYQPKTVIIGKVKIPEGQNYQLKLTAGHSLTHTIANVMEVKLIPVN